MISQAKLGQRIAGKLMWPSKRLEQGYVKCRVYAAALGKFQRVCNRTRMTNDFKRTKITAAQLEVVAVCDGGLPVRLELNPDPIANLEGDIFAFLVSLLAHSVLSPEQIVFEML